MRGCFRAAFFIPKHNISIRKLNNPFATFVNFYPDGTVYNSSPQFAAATVPDIKNDREFYILVIFSSVIRFLNTFTFNEYLGMEV